MKSKQPNKRFKKDQNMRTKYLNPFTDYGFKRLFATEYNKDLLIDFLNQVLEGEEEITDIKYLTNEQLGRTPESRNAVFDIICEDAKGNNFIVEMQMAPENYFIDRSIYYASFPIQKQSKKGDWNYRLDKVYVIGILNFVFQKEDEYIKTQARFYDIVRKKVLSDKLTLVYLEMPKFKKREEELETRFDKWMYVLTKLPNLERMPEKLKDNIFEKLFIEAELAVMPEQEQMAYDASLKVYRDNVGVIRTAWEQGQEQGKKQKAIETAKAMLADGMPKEQVAKYTGLSVKEIENL